MVVYFVNHCGEAAGLIRASGKPFHNDIIIILSRDEEGCTYRKERSCHLRGSFLKATGMIP